MNSIKINSLQEQFGWNSYRSIQIQHAFFSEHLRAFNEIKPLPLLLRKKLEATTSVLSFAVTTIKKSKDSRAYKALFRLVDGLFIESVLLKTTSSIWTCCISSQVGCAMKCSFCATGIMGLHRHLNNEEITDQVLFWLQFVKYNSVKASIKNIVYMGMGEPLHNKKEVFLSINELCNPNTFNFSARHISVSTSGLVPVIYEFTNQFPQVNLAISLHAGTDELRQKLMPVNKAYPLALLLAAIEYHIANTNRKVFIEYILIENVNDGVEHAFELVKLFNGFRYRKLIHVNLIYYNKTNNSNYRESSGDRANKFRAILSDNHIQCTIRKNLGRDIDGACGQLVVSNDQLVQEKAH